MGRLTSQYSICLLYGLVQLFFVGQLYFFYGKHRTLLLPKYLIFPFSTNFLMVK